MLALWWHCGGGVRLQTERARETKHEPCTPPPNRHTHVKQTPNRALCSPCQTPTLNFCVERHQQIVAFQPEAYWRVQPAASKAGARLPLEWERGRVFDADAAGLLLANVRDARALRVQSVTVREERRPRPAGLNTVELLKAASSGLGMGPAHAMRVAESLYTSGYLSYPRTESSAYPANFDLEAALRSQARHPVWGEYAAAVLAARPALPKVRGRVEGEGDGRW